MPLPKKYYGYFVALEDIAHDIERDMKGDLSLDEIRALHRITCAPVKYNNYAPSDSSDSDASVTIKRMDRLKIPPRIKNIINERRFSTTKSAKSKTISRRNLNQATKQLMPQDQRTHSHSSSHVISKECARSEKKSAYILESETDTDNEVWYTSSLSYKPKINYTIKQKCKNDKTNHTKCDSPEHFHHMFYGSSELVECNDRESNSDSPEHSLKSIELLESKEIEDCKINLDVCVDSCDNSSTAYKETYNIACMLVEKNLRGGVILDLIKKLTVDAQSDSFMSQSRHHNSIGNSDLSLQFQDSSTIRIPDSSITYQSSNLSIEVEQQNMHQNLHKNNESDMSYTETKGNVFRIMGSLPYELIMSIKDYVDCWFLLIRNVIFNRRFHKKKRLLNKDLKIY